MERALMNVDGGHMTTVHELRLSTGRASFLLQRLGNISRYRVVVGCGSFDLREIAPGLFVGRSAFDRKDTFVSLYVDRTRLIVDNEVGRSREQMQSTTCRGLSQALLGLGPDQAVVTLITWRLVLQSDAAWGQFGCIHEAEMFLIKGLLER
jgi:hypothetical protein